MSKLDPENWDPPEYLAISDRKFLTNRAQTIYNIQDAAYLAMGQVLLQVKEKFENDPKVDKWFTRWVEEATPLTRGMAYKLIKIAEGCRDLPEMVELLKTHQKTSAYLIAALPTKIRKGVVDELRATGAQLSIDELKSIGASPEADLADAEEIVLELQTKLAKASLAYTTSTGQEKRNAASNKTRAKTQLELAIHRLSESRAKVKSLEKVRSTQDLVVEQLQRQILQKNLREEELQQDPLAKHKRAVAKTIVDASNGLDLLLQSLDKYEVNKEELGAEAIKAIERKMALVKVKLMKMNVTT